MFTSGENAARHGKSNFPKAVTLMEVGLRDGLQSEKRTVPTPLKVDIISGLAASGIQLIQVGAFVSPKRVPQMADADRLPALLAPTAGITYNFLVLSRGGFERALSSGVESVEISASVSDTHSKKNTGMPRHKAIREAAEMIGMGKSSCLHVRASVQCAFGCAYEKNIDPDFVLSTSRTFLSRHPDMLVLADTTGMATPNTVNIMLKRILPETGDVPLALHLHDTRGFGLANVVAAMECGVTHFDTALSGMGGCPFVPGAAGNISTEETARMMMNMDIQTGIDIEAVTRCARRLRAYLTGSHAKRS